MAGANKYSVKIQCNGSEEPHFETLTKPQIEQMWARGTIDSIVEITPECKGCKCLDANGEVIFCDECKEDTYDRIIRPLFE